MSDYDYSLLLLCWVAFCQSFLYTYDDDDDDDGLQEIQLLLLPILLQL